jgi:cellulose synthase operon protein C
VIEKGLVANPDSPELYMLLAEIHQLNKQYKAAIAVYDKLLVKNPALLVALNNYVSIVADFEADPKTLEQAYARAQKLSNSGIAAFLDTVGWISYRVGKLDEAEQHLKQAILKIPENATFHYHLGKIYLAKKDQVNAKLSLEKALLISNKQDKTLASEISKLLNSV